MLSDEVFRQLAARGDVDDGLGGFDDLGRVIVGALKDVNELQQASGVDRVPSLDIRVPILRHIDIWSTR